jgi:hypothetical protein
MIKMYIFVKIHLEKRKFVFTMAGYTFSDKVTSEMQDADG